MTQSEAIAISILRSYGLTELLTDRDDPTLWAAVVRKYWPIGVVLGPRSGHGVVYQWNREEEGLWVEKKRVFKYVL